MSSCSPPCGKRQRSNRNTLGWRCMLPAEAHNAHPMYWYEESRNADTLLQEFPERMRRMRQYDPGNLIIHAGNANDPHVVVEVTPDLAVWAYIHFHLRPPPVPLPRPST